MTIRQLFGGRRRPLSTTTVAAAEGGGGTSVEEPPPPVPPTITTTALADATVSVAYSFTMGVSQGEAPYTWSATGLPAGLSIASGTGIISGTPTDLGTTEVIVTVTDNNAESTSKTLPLTVGPAVGSGTATTIITDYQEYAPDNSRGVEGYVLYDTNISAASTTNTPGGGFNTPSGTIIYVATTGVNAVGNGTTLAPYETITYAVNAANATTGNKTILLRSSDLGTDEAVFRESFPQIAPTSKVIGIQAEKGAKVWISGSDIFDSADWTYVAGTGWRYDNVYAPPLTTAAGTPATDQVFVDGVPYVQKTALPIVAGEFYVDTAAQRLYLGEASGWAIGSHTIEVTVRAYVNGGQSNRNAKNNLFIRGIGFKHWGTAWQNDVYGALMFGGAGTSNGQNQLLEYCTFAYSSANHANFTQTTGMRVYQCVFQNSGGLAAHGDRANTITIRYCRFERSNWELGYPIQPSATGRVAGIKITSSTTPTVVDCLFRNTKSNGLWFDVHCTNFTVARNTFIDCLGYGFTCENGGGANNYYVGNLHIRCGNTTYGNNDAYRFAGWAHVRCYNNTSLDNVGVGANFIEYDWTYDTDFTTTPNADGDTFDAQFKNNVIVVTSRSIKGGFLGGNFHPSPPGAYPPGVSLQTPTFRSEQSFSPDPYAATLAPQDDWNVWVRINCLASRPVFKWGTPETNFTGAPAQFQKTTNYTLAQVQALKQPSDGTTYLGCEANSLSYTDTSGTDAARLAAWFPDASSGDYSWSALSTIPTQAASTSGTVPPDAVCDLLGISHGATAKFGVYTHPWPIPA